MYRALANGLVQLVLEPECPVCRLVLEAPLDGPVCAACWRALARRRPPWCARCGETLPAWARGDCHRCTLAGFSVTRTRSVGLYAGALRHLILEFKYGGHRALGRPLAALMREAGADVLDGAAAVIPVPLWRGRARARGYNQADELAQRLGVPVWRILRRRRPGRPQAGLSVDQRFANVRGAYGLTRAVAFWSMVAPPLGLAVGRPLRGTTVVLVDDVMATGATLEACGHILRRAGVAEVRAVTTARALRRWGQRVSAD
jgi:predicted amidophosphoribosyltransferase